MNDTTSSNVGNVGALLSNAANAGVIGPGAMSLLSIDLDEVVIAGAAGTAMEDIVASDVTLITVLIDASHSIGMASLEQAVRDGENALVDAFGGSKERDAILMAVFTFADQVKLVHSYVPVEDAVRLDANNYRAGGCTTLYDAWCDGLTANVAYAQLLRDSGTPCRSVVVIVTDGEDVGSKRTAADCARLSADLLKSEQFVLAFVGVGKEADFRKVARDMGVPDGCVAVQSNATPSALRATFRMVSQSAIRASQGKIAPGINAGFFHP